LAQSRGEIAIMFWRFGGYANVSTIDSLLEKPDVTVEELLDDADLIQEVKSQNSKLLEFLRDENILDRLMQYTIMPKAPEEHKLEDDEQDLEEEDGGASSNPLNSLFGKNKRRSKSIKDEEESKDEKQRLKYAFVASEVLASDVWSIAEALLENRDSLRRFWHYLKRDAPLDGASAQYFCKVNESLLDKKTEEMLEFFKSVDGVVADMLRHVDCAVMMDMLLKIVSLERVEGGAGIIDVSCRLMRTKLKIMLTSYSGCKLKISYHCYFLIFQSSMNHQLKLLLETFLKLSSQYQQTQLRRTAT
jgi:SIT4-associating protein SAP185/190